MHVFVYNCTCLNCELLINPIMDKVVANAYMDNTGNSIANTCIIAQLTRRVIVISRRLKQDCPGLRLIMIIQ